MKKNVFLLRTLPYGIRVNGYLRFVLKSTLVENLAGKYRTCNDSITNEKQNKANLLLQNLLKMGSHTFAAVRGYHFYRRYWRPQENEKLICLHEPGNAFDRFAIKTVKENGEIVGHLPKEISRITKYYLDRGASICIADCPRNITAVLP